MRSSAAALLPIACLVAACGGAGSAGGQSAAGIAGRNPASTAVIRRLLSSPPPGTAVYKFKTFSVRDGDHLSIFPDSATVERSASGVTVTTGPKNYQFSTSAVITQNSGTYTRFVYPNHPVPSDLAGMKPAYITQ